MSTLDYADAMVSSFVTIFLFTLWVGKHIESGFVLHGILVGVVAILLFVVVIFALNRTFAEPPLYVVAHFLKILGGLIGGLVAQRRRHSVIRKDAQVTA
jgi:putative membrane protein (TIGR04086 family)